MEGENGQGIVEKFNVIVFQVSDNFL